MIKKSFYKNACEVAQNEPHYQPQTYLISMEKKKRREAYPTEFHNQLR